MIAGHGPLAFAIAASVAAAAGVDRRRALQFGLVAGAFAVIPDADITYAVVGLAAAEPTGIWTATEAFWASSKAVHRGITHSLVLGLPAATGFALAARPARRGVVAVPLLGGLVLAGGTLGGPLSAAVLAVFVVAGVGLAKAAAAVGFRPRSILAAAGCGLLTHPFGDLFTGTPPQLLYPLGIEVVPGRVVLLGDPTLNLLGVFGLELAAIWLGILVAARLHGWSLRAGIDWPAATGAGYGIAALVLPAPTLDVSYHFVFSVLAVGTVGVVPLRTRPRRERVAIAAVTGTAAVTIAVAAFTAVYAIAGGPVGF